MIIKINTRKINTLIKYQRCLSKTMMISKKKKTSTNYKNKFKMNQMLKNMKLV
jgi:hypothetical protein